jgi:hypothetical protein
MVLRVLSLDKADRISLGKEQGLFLRSRSTIDPRSGIIGGYYHIIQDLIYVRDCRGSSRT